MQIIPSSLIPARDKSALIEFLGACREAARKKGRYQLASISLKVPHIAPLAVLQSIYAPSELHFYMEQTASDQALAGADAVVGAEFEGADRFQRVKAFSEDVLANTIAIGDLDAPFSGPHFFTAFSFAEQAEAGALFPAATVFVPRWQVSRTVTGYGAVANIRIDPDAEVAGLAERVWGAYQRFGAFDYAGAPEARAGEASAPPKIACRALATEAFQKAVAQALQEIDRGDYAKIVLARVVELCAEQALRPLDTLNRLREKFPGCFAFSFGGKEGCSFIGASPERLVQLEEGRVQTEAIAGSTPRGGTAAADAAHGRALLGSEKDLQEHAYVRDSICRRLASIGITASPDPVPRLLQLANVQHLLTPITGKAPKGTHLLDLAEVLHPTPAVGGTPRSVALPRIRDLEGFDRGLYAGLVGAFNHRGDGQLIVGIRSAEIAGQRARLFTGAGIVPGSTPEGELRETEMKLNALLSALTEG